MNGTLLSIEDGTWGGGWVLVGSQKVFWKIGDIHITS